MKTSEKLCQDGKHQIEFVSEKNGEIDWACKVCPFKDTQFQDCSSGC